MNSTLLVDANNLALRSHFAPKTSMSVKSVETGTLVLFVNSLSRYVRHVRPDYGAACWDGGASAYRLRVYAQYKAARKQKYSDEPRPPFDLIQDFLFLAGFPQLELPGYEGDDLIYAYWRACRGRSRVFIVSGDKDLGQLIEDGTEQIKPQSNQQRLDKLDKAKFITTYGYRPEHFPYVLALAGDVSDSIPGLKGVGDKTAVKMLKKEDWDMARVLVNLPEDDQETVLRNLALIDLSCVPLEFDKGPPALCLVGPGDEGWEDLAKFLDRLELKLIKSKLEDQSLWQ